MLLYLDRERYIVSYNDNLTQPEAAEQIANGAIWYDGIFSFLDGEERQGFLKKFKWDGEKPVAEYIPINQPQPTQFDRIEAAMDYMVMQK